MAATYVDDLPATGSDDFTIVVHEGPEGLRQALDDIRDLDPPGEVRLDMQYVLAVTSADLSQLISDRLELDTRGRRMRLLNVQPDIVEILSITKLDRLFAVEPASRAITV